MRKMKKTCCHAQWVDAAVEDNRADLEEERAVLVEDRGIQHLGVDQEVYLDRP
jgi:hypothetical protein